MWPKLWQPLLSAILVYKQTLKELVVWSSVEMVLCLFVDCHARSGRDRNVSFFRVPVIDKKNGEEAEELSTEHWTKLITAISRDDLTEQILKNDRVCSHHFVSSHPGKPWDKYNVDWVPTLNLRHTKRKAEDMGKAVQGRAERAKVRRKKKLNEEA